MIKIMVIFLDYIGWWDFYRLFVHRQNNLYLLLLFMHMGALTYLLGGHASKHIVIYENTWLNIKPKLHK